jgi:hypothetical protein
MAEEISPLENHGWWMERLRKDAKANRPEALRLADELGRYYTHLTVVPDINREAAAELRRLHAEVNELKRTLALQQQSYEREIQIEVEAEREACARLCEELAAERPTTGAGKLIAQECAEAIRARGNA